MIRLTATLSLLTLVGCSVLQTAPPTRSAPIAAEVRIPSAEPTFVATTVCPPGVVCSLADQNADGRADLVRRDIAGVFGPPGSVSVALSDGWGFGSFKPFAHGCGKKELCLVGNIDGVRGLEVVVLEPEIGRVTVRRFEGGKESANPVVLADKGFCKGQNQYCSLVQADSDPQAELAWLDGDGRMWAIDTMKPGKPERLQIGCNSESHCHFVEFDGKPGAELLSWGKTYNYLTVRSLKGDSSRTLPIDCSNAICKFADVDGDGLVDILQWVAGDKPQWWLSSKNYNAPQQIDTALRCGNGERCLWADGNGDRVADFFRIDPQGNLAFHPAFDDRMRLEAAATELSVLATNQARAQIAEVEAAERLIVSRFAPERVEPEYGTDTAALREVDALARRTSIATHVEALAVAILGAIPAENEIVTDADVRRVRELAMRVVAARTILGAVPLGVSRRGGATCTNAVLHERIVIDGVEHRRPSALFRFAQALTEARDLDRMEHLVGAMSAIAAGFRCLNSDELVILDAAFSDAVLQTASELVASGRPLAARWLIDSALPIALLTFDAAKYTMVPPSYRLFAARVGARVEPGMVPSAGFDFTTARNDPSCQTFRCQTYGNPRRTLAGERGLMLDRIGVWLPDPLNSGRLSQLRIDPHELLSAMMDLRIFGEGDCSMFEVANLGFRCPSRSTCRSGAASVDPNAAMAGSFGLETSPPDPGEPGSSLTHLLTSRGSELERANGCGTSGGSGAASGAACMGAPVGSRRGTFSANPELDRIMRCTFESASAPVDVDINLGRGCLTRQQVPEGEAPEAPAEPPSIPELFQQFPGIRAQVVEMLRNGGEVRIGDFVYTRDQIVNGIQEAFPGSERLTEERIIELLRGDVADAVAGARPGTAGGNRGITGGALAHPRVEVNIGRHSGFDDPAGELGRTLLHEAIHVFLMEAEVRGWVRTGFGREEARDHRVTRSMGLNLCSGASDCASGCGLGDSFVKRFTECIEPTPPVDASDIECASAIDYCENRATGDIAWPLGESCLPSFSVAPEPDCLVVNCADSSYLSGRCCGGTPSGGSIDIFRDLSSSPGPRPPAPVLEMSFDDYIRWPL